MARLGEIIRQKRSELGLTLDDLQARTKIRGKYLEAIEAGDYQVIPGEVYLRGFIRSISSELEIDVDLALQAYRQDTGKATEESAQSVQEPPKPSTTSQIKREAGAPAEQRVLAKPAEVAPALPNRSTRTEPSRAPQPKRIPWIVIGLSLVLIIAAGYWYWTTAQEQPLANPPVTQDPGEGAAPPGEGEPAPDPEPTVVLQDPNVKDPVYLVKEGRIDVSVTAVRGSCWLRAEWGNQVIDKTLKAGSTTEGSFGFQSDQQVTIRLGNAPAVKLTINGEEQAPITGEQVRTVTIKTNP